MESSVFCLVFRVLGFDFSFGGVGSRFRVSGSGLSAVDRRASQKGLRTSLSPLGYSSMLCCGLQEPKNSDTLTTFGPGIVLVHRTN